MKKALSLALLALMVISCGKKETTTTGENPSQVGLQAHRDELKALHARLDRMERTLLGALTTYLSTAKLEERLEALEKQGGRQHAELMTYLRDLWTELHGVRDEICTNVDFEIGRRITTLQNLVVDQNNNLNTRLTQIQTEIVFKVQDGLRVLRELIEQKKPAGQVMTTIERLRLDLARAMDLIPTLRGQLAMIRDSLPG